MSRARDLAAFVSNADGDIKFDTDTLFIDSSANKVGISTSSPSTKLEVNGNSASRNTITDTMTVNGGTDVSHPYYGFGLGIEFKGDDYSNVQRNYGKIYTVMDGHTSSTTSAGDAGFKSRMDFYINRGGASTTNPTQQMFIKSDGDVHITDGNLGVANGHGIDFSASEGSGASSSILNDYEEGTFTPTLKKGSHTNFTYANQIGKYTKIGNVYKISFYVFCNNTATTNNGATWEVTGIPFNISSLANCAYQFVACGYLIIGNTNYGNNVHRWQANSSTSLSLYGQNGTQEHTGSNLELSGTGILTVA